MKKRLVVLSLATVLLVAGIASGQPERPERTFTGEIVDISCYVTSGARSVLHAACAKNCLQEGGQPMGLLTTDGTLALLARYNRDHQPYEALKEWAGRQVGVGGSVGTRHDMLLITVTHSWLND